MDKEILKRKLDALGVYSNFFSLSGELLPDRVVLYQNYNSWEVFYFDERGNRNNEKVFSSEGEACNYIYEHFVKEKEIERKYK